MVIPTSPSTAEILQFLDKLRANVRAEQRLHSPSYESPALQLATRLHRVALEEFGSHEEMMKRLRGQLCAYDSLIRSMRGS